MKLAVHLHLYYLKQLPVILKYLHSLDGQNYDLFVTMVAKNKEAETAIKSFNPKTKIMIVPNRGYDLGPFIEFLHKINLNAYDLILKVHTKAPRSNNFTILNNHSMSNRLWNHILWDAVLGSRDQVAKCLKQFKNKHVGMIGAEYCLTDEQRTYEELLPGINQSLLKIGLEPVAKTKFIAGTMFYVRADLMKSFLIYSTKDFTQTDGNVKNYTLAHVLERVVAEVVHQKGYKIVGISCTHKFFIQKSLACNAILHFIYQNKWTKSGAHIIKIFRIPVYHKKGYKHV